MKKKIFIGFYITLFIFCLIQPSNATSYLAPTIDLYSPSYLLMESSTRKSII